MGGTALYNTQYKVIFPHDIKDDETIRKYIRRFERLKEIIVHSTEHLYFIYTSQSSLETGNFTIDGETMAKDVYVYLSKIYTLIGDIRSNYTVIVFDTIQDESVELLDPHIILHKLNRCGGWVDIIPQMRVHIDFLTANAK